MNEQDILATTYHDTADIYRRVSLEKDAVTGQTRQAEQLIVSGVSGAWSKTKDDTYHTSGKSGLARVDGTFFCAPKTDIMLGDRVVVHTEMGDTLDLRAGRPMRYVSHANVPLGGDDRA
ncbi:hypothetical protein LJC27_01855 [Christensenellaceae bacterium OttesenSCG-928-M15]|nr:hypothetical protein [Christensenellaceae bacterium OttesenSCG-928-M15]